MTPTALLALAAQWEGRIARDLLAVLLRVKAGIPLGPVEEAILRRDADAAVEALGLDAVTSALWDARKATDAMRETAWQAALRELPRALIREVIVTVSYAGHVAANRWVMDAIHAADLARIEGVTRNTAEGLREILREGLAQGTPPRELARTMRDLVGLNKRQARSLTRYRAGLIAEGREADQVQRMADRRQRRLLRERTEMIARTETITALNTARETQWQRLESDGVIQKPDWVRVWVVAQDERTCPACQPFSRQAAPIGGTFTAATPDAPVQTSAGPTLHPRCRCVTVLQLAALYRQRMAERLAA